MCEVIDLKKKLSGMTLRPRTPNTTRMCDVYDLGEERQKRDPHTVGKAQCLLCDHHWVAVQPLGVDLFECPCCGGKTGIYMALISEDIIRMCQCGNTYFQIAYDERIYCPQCGETIAMERE